MQRNRYWIYSPCKIPKKTIRMFWKTSSNKPCHLLGETFLCRIKVVNIHVLALALWLFYWDIFDYNYFHVKYSQRNTCFICQSLWLCGHNKLWKILKEMGILDYLTCLLRNLYAGQEATVRTGHGTADWFQIRKGVRQGCILSPSLFNLYADCIMQNAGWKKHKLESRFLREI